MILTNEHVYGTCSFVSFIATQFESMVATGGGLNYIDFYGNLSRCFYKIYKNNEPQIPEVYILRNLSLVVLIIFIRTVISNSRKIIIFCRNFSRVVLKKFIRTVSSNSRKNVFLREFEVCCSYKIYKNNEPHIPVKFDGIYAL